MFTLNRCLLQRPNLAKIRWLASHKKKKMKCKSPEEPLLDFECKVALITGGSHGIGFTIAHEILAENAKNVAIVGLDTCAGRDSVTSLNAAHGKNKSLFLKGDVKCNVQFRECLQKAIEEFGRVDIFVNSAGVWNGAKWEEELHTNLEGTIRGTLLALKYMSRECGNCGGTILNVSGTYGLEPFSSAPTLSAAQHGIVGLTRSIGHRHLYARTGVRVVTLCPGITNTDFLRDAPARALTQPALCEALEAHLTRAKRQNADVAGKAAVHLLKYAPTGSVWTVEGSRLYSVKVPNWRSNSQLVAQYF